MLVDDIIGDEVFVVLFVDVLEQLKLVLGGGVSLQNKVTGDNLVALGVQLHGLDDIVGDIPAEYHIPQAVDFIFDASEHSHFLSFQYGAYPAVPAARQSWGSFCFLHQYIQFYYSTEQGECQAFGGFWGCGAVFVGFI